MSEYPEAERAALEDTLWHLFDRIPPEVHLFFNIRSMDLRAEDATLEVEYYFRIKTLTPENRRFRDIRGMTTLNFQKNKPKWVISRIRPFIFGLRKKIEQ